MNRFILLAAQLDKNAAGETMKKGDMNFWLVMLVIALVFMAIMFFVMNNVFTKWGESTGKIQEETDKQIEEMPSLFDTEEDSKSGTTDG